VSTVIALRGATFGYDDVPAVIGVDLTVEAGEVVALIGPNGSGKSTLVRGLLGLVPRLDGSVETVGRRRIGYVPQRHTVGGTIPSTVDEVVSSGRLVHRPWWAPAGAQDRAAVAEAIAAVGLSDRTRTPVSHLSGGQQRRVLIARALAGRPEVMIMDEPTAGVDAANQAALTRTLRSLVGGGLTLIVVTHEITSLRPVLTRVVAMDGGKLVSDAPAPYAGLDISTTPDVDCHHDATPAHGVSSSLLGSPGVEG
jgi:zinc transport system ATP-binding protein